MVIDRSGDGTTFADDKTDGLILRVRKSSASFSLKFAGKTRVLGELSESERGNARPGEIQTIQAARELADKVRALMKDGLDPASFISGKGVGKSDEDAKMAVQRQAAVDAGRWTWERLVAEYTEGYLAKPRIVRQRLRQPSQRSVENARRALAAPEANELKGLLLSELTPGHLEYVRDECAMRVKGGKTASRSFVANAKAALSFAKKKHRERSGLGGERRWWLEVEILDSTAVEPRTRMPSLEDLAKVLYRAEKHRILPDRQQKRRTSETVLCALWWLVLTGQRASAGIALEKAHILPYPDGPAGWRVVFWSETAMKSRRAHALPIPPRLVMLIERAVAFNGDTDSKFVFPATASRTQKGDLPIARTAPKNLLTRMRGIDNSPQRKGVDRRVGVDLLEDVPHFSMHDGRRTFATALSNRAIRGDAISAVLDHAGLETGQQMMRTAEVTNLAYAIGQRLDLKQLAMQAWTDMVFEAVEDEWKRNRNSGSSNPLKRLARMKAAEDVSKGVQFSEDEPWYAIMERLEAKKPSRKIELRKTADEADDLESRRYEAIEDEDA
ncbi:MAG: tyrosine-type recombinase/integrase [Alphaproteobacteria bacterium]|nr:tyrosine-type recombinase/integrase [Alphaproteobacteria bacterium]MBU2336584.1 tyrosine-type recombinase/integrase [Alphaproteobacteria bacterium]